MSKSTEELLDMLSKEENVDSYLEKNKDKLVSIDFVDYLKQLLEEKGLTKAEVINNSNMSQVYGYQIFSGVKKGSRNKLLQLAFSMHLSIEQTQHLLIMAGEAELYPRFKRDSIIIFCINKAIPLMECDTKLYEAGEATISKL